MVSAPQLCSQGDLIAPRPMTSLTEGPLSRALMSPSSKNETFWKWRGTQSSDYLPLTVPKPPVIRQRGRCGCPSRLQHLCPRELSVVTEGLSNSLWVPLAPGRPCLGRKLSFPDSLLHPSAKSKSDLFLSKDRPWQREMGREPQQAEGLFQKARPWHRAESGPPPNKAAPPTPDSPAPTAEADPRHPTPLCPPSWWRSLHKPLPSEEVPPLRPHPHGLFSGQKFHWLQGPSWAGGLIPGQRLNRSRLLWAELTTEVGGSPWVERACG